MGNTSSNVTSGVKNQVNSGSRALYKLADLGGGGELIQLMKEAIKTKDYTEIDAKILKEIPQFLYDGGQGKLIHISEVISQRHEERTGSKQFKTVADKKGKKQKESNNEIETQTSTGTYKEVCWDLNQRGSVGETTLHTCFLVGSNLHLELAKRIITYFPKLLNDIYLCDEYYGENVLHMAIVHEDPAMVRFLLNHDVNVHQRCCGNFFTADDQKSSRSDSPDHEWVDLCYKTNYGGHNYWGEYPLSFAACLMQEECFRLLIVRGADPNMQDTNGNTVLHICIIHDNTKMFDLANQQGANLNIKNRQGLTPLTLAAQLAKPIMFNHVLSIEREVIWTYGSVTCSAYPLEGVDSINILTGDLDPKSALALAVYGTSETHLDLLDGLLEELLKKKWETFGRKSLYQSLALFLIYFLIYAVGFLLRPTPFIVLDRSGMLDNGSKVNVTELDIMISESCYLAQYDSATDQIRLVCEIFSIVGAAGYILSNIIEVHYTGYTLYFESLFGFPARTLFLISLVLSILMIPMRLACWFDGENIIGVVAVVLMSLNFLFYCRGFKTVGPFVLMVYKILADDMVKFFLIYSIFVMGFAQAFYIIFLGQDDLVGVGKDGAPMNDTLMGNVFESVLRMFVVSLNEFSLFYGELHQSRHPVLGKILFIIFLLSASIMLINLVIAMMTRTYERISASEREWLRQWAAIILKMEQGLTPKARIKALLEYSRPIDGELTKRALIVHWRQTAEERTAQHEKRIEERNEYMEMKRSLLKQRLKNGPGFEFHEKSAADTFLNLFKGEE